MATESANDKDKKTLKKTAFYNVQQENGGKFVDFFGWNLPLSYSLLKEEHAQVRSRAGLFDVSHMGEVRIKGPQAAAYLNFITINDIHSLKPGQGQYTAMLNESGGMIDDLIIYQIEENHYFAVINASNIEKDTQWMQKQAESYDVSVEDESPKWSQLALQGPESEAVMRGFFAELGINSRYIEQVNGLSTMQWTEAEWKGKGFLVARTGYTGEKGYELYFNMDKFTTNDLEEIWRCVLRQKNCTPIGLAARDTLRLEACYLLYGNDMNESVNPLEAGIAWAVKLGKGPFIGSEVLMQQKENKTIARRNVGFMMVDKAMPRHDMKIFHGDKQIGVVTSGNVLPSAGGFGGMALIDSSIEKAVGMEVEIDIRGKRKLAKIVKKPLYKINTK